MKHRLTFCALFATSMLVLAGCEQTATKAIHVQPPAECSAHRRRSRSFSRFHLLRILPTWLS